MNEWCVMYNQLMCSCVMIVQYTRIVGHHACIGERHAQKLEFASVYLVVVYHLMCCDVFIISLYNLQILLLRHKYYY